MCLLLFTGFRCFVLLGSLARSCLDSNMRRGQNSVPVELRINNFLLLKDTPKFIVTKIESLCFAALVKIFAYKFSSTEINYFPSTRVV
jgi:hypothetical protein